MEVNKYVMGCIYSARIYRAKNCKNYFKIERKIFFFLNVVVADVAQRENSSIKHYVSAFSNI